MEAQKRANNNDKSKPTAAGYQSSSICSPRQPVAMPRQSSTASKKLNASSIIDNKQKAKCLGNHRLQAIQTATRCGDWAKQVNKCTTTMPVPVDYFTDDINPLVRSSTCMWNFYGVMDTAAPLPIALRPMRYPRAPNNTLARSILSEKIDAYPSESSHSHGRERPIATAEDNENVSIPYTATIRHCSRAIVYGRVAAPSNTGKNCKMVRTEKNQRRARP
jgi:hypothetical protein